MSRLGLLLSFLAATSCAAFVAKPGIDSSGPGKQHHFNFQTLTYHQPSADGTSLHVGVSYGPPIFGSSSTTDDKKSIGSVLQRTAKGAFSQKSEYKFYNSNSAHPLEIDPSYQAVAIHYPDSMEEISRQQRERHWKKALGASTAVLCAAFMTKALAMNYATILSGLSCFFVNYPMPASMTVCGLNGITADLISQVKAWKQKGDGGLFQLEMRSNLSAIVYGGLYMGICSNLAYTKLIPFLFGIESNVKTIVASALFDNFVGAPLMWLPPAYLIKTIFFDTTPKQALGNYVKDVTEGGLLFKYWSLWVPAQLVSFSVVPKHLRVTFMAAISFVWFMILSSLTSKKEAPAN